MNKNSDRFLAKKDIKDVLGPPPFQVLATSLGAVVLLLVALFGGIDLDGLLGLASLILFWILVLLSPAILFVVVGNFLGMRKPYTLIRNRLSKGEIYPDFYMPKSTLGTHFLFVDRSLGKLITSHSNYREGYPVNDLYQLTCGFEGKRHFMVLRFRSGAEPELHITAKSQADANQQIIRLQNFLGWN